MGKEFENASNTYESALARYLSKKPKDITLAGVSVRSFDITMFMTFAL